MSSNIECKPVNSDEIEQLFKWNYPPEDKTKTCEDAMLEAGNIASSAVNLVNFFVILLQDYFEDPNNINNDYIRELILTKNIVVTSMSSFDTDVQGSTPRIIVEFSGKQAQQNFALGNKIGYNIHNSSTDYYTHWQTGISLYVIGNTLNETLLLAEEVGNFCHCFQEDICNAASLLRCQIAEISKPQYLEESNGQKSYLSVISMTAVTSYGWTITRSAPVLKRVTFKPKHEQL